MKPWKRWGLLSMMVGFYVACSPKQFSQDPDYHSLCNGTNQACIDTPEYSQFTVEESVSGGKLDLLIVDDNSASMSTEQAQLANRFNNFIANLDNKKIDYRIGVTTTDVSSGVNPSRGVNQDGALQDGRLITFGNGKKYLTSDAGSLADKDNWFKTVIKRPETISCESFINNWVNVQHKSMDGDDYANGYYAACPSGDERGVNAANMLVSNNYESFIRPEADLAIIFLSDENIRSNQWSDYAYALPGFPIEEKDKAANLISLIQSTYAGKKFTSHSIVTQTAACLATQSAQMGGLVSGSYGYEYIKLTDQTGGVRGDICAADYTTQLSSIFNNVTVNIVDKFALECENAELIDDNNDGNKVDGLPGGITYSIVGKTLKLSAKLPVGSSVRFVYRCKK